ncbi:MAG: FtsK/SpoIIIE domain-containing protein [Microbacterium sp.]
MLSNFAPTAMPVPGMAGSAPPSHAEPLELPPPWRPGSRPAVPLLASVVPVLGAVALWLVTGSVLALWLAALGPLIAGATMLDGARGARRDRRRAEAAARVARDRIAREITERHADERARRWSRHPDVAAFAARDGEIWRPIAGRGELLVVGCGVDASDVRVSGGGDDPESAALRGRAARLEDAPVLVPPSLGIAVVGGAVVAGAVMRALVLQLCMSVPPGELRITGALRGENAWAERLPHRRASVGATVTLSAPGEAVGADADIVIVRVDPSGARPPACGVVMTVSSPGRALVDVGGEVREIAVEAVGSAQAGALADQLAERAARLLGLDDASEPVELGRLLADAPHAIPGGLPAVIGVESGEPFVLDLVSDGPHAVVAGVTGSGKSELLVTWILALCANHSTREVSFLLADFKGGTAFDALADVPHITGVITDLDGAGARRAIESLRAEVRWREAELARAGARDILDARVDLPRLVIVVDEFAALLGEHPELHAVFTDVAARGRALGMHLVLGTQRPSGVVRESLLANCPLRISLRVTDPTDSRAIIGTDDAAALPGGPGARGLALVRAAGDVSPRRVRIALSSRADAGAITAATDGPRPRRPWLPELPGRIDLEDLRSVAGGTGDALLLGLADEPDLQRQVPVGVLMRQRGLLVIGSGGSGKSTALRTIAAQAPHEVVWVPATGEGAWDAVADLSDRTPAPGSMVVIDDLDALGAALPPDYARELMERLDRLARGAGEAEILVVASAQRLGGGAARLAELLPRRLVLAASSRAEHIAAGGDPAHYAPGCPPGRGRLDGRAVQVAVAAPRETPRPAAALPWRPQRSLTGFVMRRTPITRAAIAEWERSGARILSLDDFASDAEWPTSCPVVVAGDAEEWQRHWRTLSSMRSDHDLLVDASCGPEFRVLTGERGLPPYCDSGRGRAWLMRAGGAPERVTLPSGHAGERS